MSMHEILICIIYTDFYYNNIKIAVIIYVAFILWAILIEGYPVN